MKRKNSLCCFRQMTFTTALDVAHTKMTKNIPPKRNRKTTKTVYLSYYTKASLFIHFSIKAIFINIMFCGIKFWEKCIIRGVHKSINFNLFAKACLAYHFRLT